MKVHLRCFLLLAAWHGLTLASTAAELPYVTNRAAAFAIAQKEERTIVLYTGRAVFCPSNEPRGYFFNVVLPHHPRLMTRSDKYVVCEQFAFATNVMSSQFGKEYDRLHDILTNYHINEWSPTITLLDAKGHKLSGPFVRYSSENPVFGDTGDQLYETLQEYLAAESPLTFAEAQSNLVRAVSARGTEGSAVGLFRSVPHPEGGQKKLLLENGGSSTKYAIGTPLQFHYLRGTIQRGIFDGAGFEESLVAVTGTFPGTQSYTGSILVRVNDAYFRSTVEPVGNRPDHYRNVGGVRVEAGEYYFLVYVREDSVARALLRELKARFEKDEKVETGIVETNVEVVSPAPVKVGPTFDVILLSSPLDKKIAVIKAVREVKPGVGLAEAKTMVESVPQPVLRGVPRPQADEAARILEQVGARVEIR